MKKLLAAFLLVCIYTNFLPAMEPEGEKQIVKSFSAVEKIKIKLALGDCRIRNGSPEKIDVKLEYSYSDEYFEAHFREGTNSLTIEELFHDNDHSGHAFWDISVPKDAKIKFESGTGDLEITATVSEIDGNTGTGDITVTGADGEFDLNTGTGHVEVKNSQGEFGLNSGTGKVKIEDSKGEFEANSGTGDVYAGNIVITDEANFNSGTGDVEVFRPRGEDFDLSLNSGTNDAILNMGGLEIEGYFEFSANARSGDIRAPFDFDEEKTYNRGDNDKIVKSYNKGKKTPRYFIGTGTGTARLKK